jgi:hypothetical protein
MVAGGKASFDVATKIAEVVQSKKMPLVAQVLESYADGNDYVVLLRLASFSGHGICLTNVESKYPSKVTPVVERLVRGFEDGGLSRRSIAKPGSPALPFRLPPTERQDLRLRFDRKTTRAQVFNNMYGTVVLRYELLGAKGPDSLEFNVRFRDDNPVLGGFTLEDLND